MNADFFREHFKKRNLCSLSWDLALHQLAAGAKGRRSLNQLLWRVGQDSNLQPSDPKSEALSN
jgi:hypothetical protein